MRLKRLFLTLSLDLLIVCLCEYKLSRISDPICSAKQCNKVETPCIQGYSAIIGDPIVLGLGKKNCPFCEEMYMKSIYLSHFTDQVELLLSIREKKNILHDHSQKAIFDHYIKRGDKKGYEVDSGTHYQKQKMQL